MNYYKRGDAANADKIRAEFESKGIRVPHFRSCGDSSLIYFSLNKEVLAVTIKALELFEDNPDYKKLELPVKPKFKAEDRIVSKSDKSTIYRIITLHDERREYIVEIEHKDFHESCPWIAFEVQDDYELVPKKHYDIANFHAGMPVLVRADNNCRWDYSVFSRITGNKDWPFAVCNGVSFTQCIPFEGNEHLLGTTDMCDKQFINW